MRKQQAAEVRSPAPRGEGDAGGLSARVRTSKNDALRGATPPSALTVIPTTVG